MASQPRHDDLTPDTIAAALGCIDANVSREEWWRVAAALKSELGEAGFGLFDEWSKKGDGYSDKDCRDTWKSTRPGGGVNIATLIYKAQQNGFRFNDDRPKLSPEQIERRKREREEEQRRATADRRRLQGEAAKLANLVWNAASPASDDHSYLQGKQVRAHGLAIGEWPLINDAGEVFRHLADTLLIPIMDAKNGKVISLQGIMSDMDGRVQKRYLRNAAKKGGCHIIGTPPEAGGIVVFCEGYATGATIHELTGWCVVVTFDAPNLPTVAISMRDQFAQAAFLICADNDAWSKVGDIENPGLHYAKKAADGTHGFMLAPQFTDLTGEPTDWNDLAQREGGAVALAQLLNNPVSAAKPAAVIVDAPADKVPAVNDNVDYYTPLPHTGAKGKPQATIANLQNVLDRLGVNVRYDVIAKDLDISIPGEEFLAETKANASLARITSECARFEMPTAQLGPFLLYLADKNKFNPVMQWITSKPWDGVSRFADVLDTVKTREGFSRELWSMLARRWMISAVAAAAKPTGFWSKGVLVFQGAQSLGKTAWFRSLMPEQLRTLVKVGASIDPNSKDSIISAVSHWMVELGELDGTLRKADIAHLKGFISQDMDQFRRPYAKAEEKFPRHTVFFASVNPKHFLADETGNVRWWTIPVDDLNVEHGLDMQQVWAEVYTWFQAGEHWWLNRNEEALLEGSNEDHQKVDPIVERLQARLNWDAAKDLWEWRTATEILISVGVDKPTIADATKAAGEVRKMNGERFRRCKGKNLLLCPPRPSSGFGGGDDRPF